jgi:hypothetical protein
MLSFLENSVNIGTVKLGTSKKFTVQVVNLGESPVTITKVQPKCQSCTTATVDKTSLGGGDRAIMHLVFTPTSTAIVTTKQVDLKFKGEDGLFHNITFTFTAVVN